MADAMPFIHAADPVGWSSRVFVFVVAALLALRQFLPRSLPRARDFCLFATAGVCYFLARSLIVPHDHTWGIRPFLGLAVGSFLVAVLLPCRARLARELAFLTAAWLAYFLVRGAEMGHHTAAVAHAHQIISLERRLGIFVEPDLQRRVLATPGLGTVANWVYVWGHWPVIAAVLLWLVRRQPDVYPRYRTAILLSGAIGLVVFALYPVAPPRLVPDLGFVDTIAAGSRSYRVLQPPALANPYAALPSLHVGWDLLMGVALVRQAGSRLARATGVLLPVAMTAAVVLTANHYLLDAVAGVACALIGLTMAGGLGSTSGVHSTVSAARAWLRPPADREPEPAVGSRSLAPDRAESIYT